MTIMERMKELVADPTKRIELHDYLLTIIRESEDKISEEHFPVKDKWSQDNYQPP